MTDHHHSLIAITYLSCSLYREELPSHPPPPCQRTFDDDNDDDDEEEDDDDDDNDDDDDDRWPGLFWWRPWSIPS